MYSVCTFDCLYSSNLARSYNCLHEMFLSIFIHSEGCWSFGWCSLVMVSIPPTWQHPPTVNFHLFTRMVIRRASTFDNPLSSQSHLAISFNCNCNCMQQCITMVGSLQLSHFSRLCIVALCVFMCNTFELAFCFYITSTSDHVICQTVG